ncbi:MAG: helix-turn-helix domain-containing protein, partial [Clostridiaceae bacterium]|nr:helix-turn-helix domain-containing protein [Clostridiaceae bacterium]
ITQIAKAVGYDNTGCFARVFRRQEGISPREYRAYNKIGKED